MRTFILILALLSLTPVQANETYREITWEALVPKGWDPAKEFKGLDFNKLQDGDPKAIEALARMKALWDSAPTDPGLAGQKIRLPGFAIPLEQKGDQVREFLLVPYFGACIHSPPPPSNQIVHAVARKPVKKMRSMDAVWVRGTISLERADTPWGSAGYRLAVEQVSPYEPPKKP